jgi:hypothetical protein
MASSGDCEPLDLERLPTTPEDIAVLRRLRRARAWSTEELLRAIEQLPAPSLAALRARKGPRGPEPFRL